jgi:hypothetical protein
VDIIFDLEEPSVYIKNLDPRSSEEKFFYYQYKGDNKQEGVNIVRVMRDIYHLGSQHRSNEIKKVLGIW